MYFVWSWSSQSTFGIVKMIHLIYVTKLSCLWTTDIGKKNISGYA
jgi:hypothetical protein